MFKATGTTPETLANCMLAGVGRRVVIEQGYYPATVRMFLKIMDSVFFAELMANISSLLPDYQRMREEEAKKLESGSSKNAKDSQQSSTKDRSGSRPRGSKAKSN